jgi:hypothetical protein
MNRFRHSELQLRIHSTLGVGALDPTFRTSNDRALAPEKLFFF